MFYAEYRNPGLWSMDRGTRGHPQDSKSEIWHASVLLGYTNEHISQAGLYLVTEFWSLGHVQK